MKTLTNPSLLIIFLPLLLLLPSSALACRSNGHLKGIAPSPGQCNTENDSVCCQEGNLYPTFDCSPPVSEATKATLTLNSFEKGGDGGGPSECDGLYHNDTERIVALSTGWFDHQSRCNKWLKISGNGKSVLAKVVDECDSMVGCDVEHAFQQPCRNNIVDGSSAVWEALGVAEKDRGMMHVTWSDV